MEFLIELLCFGLIVGLFVREKGNSLNLSLMLKL